MYERPYSRADVEEAARGRASLAKLANERSHETPVVLQMGHQIIAVILQPLVIFPISGGIEHRVAREACVEGEPIGRPLTGQSVQLDDEI